MGLSNFRSGKGSKKGNTRNFSLLRQVKIRRDPSKSPSMDVTPSQVGANASYLTQGTHIFTVPRGVDTLTVTMYGGGGGGGKGQSGRSGFNEGGAGGAGAKLVVTLDEIPSKTQLTFSVGTGGTAGIVGGGGSSRDGGTGGNTNFTYGGTTYNAFGGFGGDNDSISVGYGGTHSDGGTFSYHANATGTTGADGEEKGNSGIPGYPASGGYGTGGTGDTAAVVHLDGGIGAVIIT
jgi:hypothetical protein